MHSTQHIPHQAHPAHSISSANTRQRAWHAWHTRRARRWPRNTFNRTDSAESPALTHDRRRVIFPRKRARDRRPAHLSRAFVPIRAHLPFAAEAVLSGRARVGTARRRSRRMMAKAGDGGSGRERCEGLALPCCLCALVLRDDTEGISGWGYCGTDDRPPCQILTTNGIL
jgi:hypothetical protein